MSKPGESPKGTFGEVRLPVSRKYVPPFSRALMLRLGGAAAAVLLVVVLGLVFAKDSRWASNGPLSVHHANLKSDCVSCHTSFEPVSNEKCSECHEKYGDNLGVYTLAAHYVYRSGDLKRAEPKPEAASASPASLMSLKHEMPCSTCHVEHEGRETDLTHVPDSKCVVCHRYGSFNSKHPEFAFAATKREDVRLKFTHIRHVQEVTRHEKLLDMEKSCLYCHTPAPEGKSFQPIQFDRSCKACHLTKTSATDRLPLRRDDAPGVEVFENRRTPGMLWPASVSPKDFQMSGDFVRKSPVHHRDAWVLENLQVIRKELQGEGGLADLLVSSADTPPYDKKALYEEALQTLKNRMRALQLRPEPEIHKELRPIEALLMQAQRQVNDPYTPLHPEFFTKGQKNAPSASPDAEKLNTLVQGLTKPCRDCHLVERGAILRVAKDQRVLRRAEFNHRAHIIQRRCLDCHTEIPFQKALEAGDAAPATEKFKDTADIQNIPTIEVCQTCHNPKTASNRCASCHLFHPNKTQRSNLLLYMD